MHASSGLRGSLSSQSTTTQSRQPLPQRTAPQRNSAQRGWRAQRDSVLCGALAGAALGVIGAAAAAAYWSRQIELEQDRLSQASNRERCSWCGGTGFEACHCTRWSDEDVGCSSCSRTGYMRCSRCGGGGTAVPIKVTIRKNV